MHLHYLLTDWLFAVLNFQEPSWRTSPKACLVWKCAASFRNTRGTCPTSSAALSTIRLGCCPAEQPENRETEETGDRGDGSERGAPRDLWCSWRQRGRKRKWNFFWKVFWRRGMQAKVGEIMRRGKLFHVHTDVRLFVWHQNKQCLWKVKWDVLITGGKNEPV